MRDWEWGQNNNDKAKKKKRNIWKRMELFSVLIVVVITWLYRL